MKHPKQFNQRGMVLVSIIIILPFLIFLTVSFLTLTMSSFSVAKQDQSRTHAQFSADAGVDYALYQISENESWVGTTAPLTIQNSPEIKTTYEVTVADIDSNHKLVTSVGKVYSPASQTEPKSIITIKATLRAVRSGGSYSVVTGVGGLYLSNSAKILGGDVLVNGEIQMSNSSQIGLTNNPVNVEVAHQNCPVAPDATYPRLCNLGEGGQPISISNSAKIYGSVKANGQTVTTGLLSPGLVASSGVVARSMPPHDRAAQIAIIAATQTATQASCSGGTKTWPANLKITGNVSISNTCKVTVLGDVWITGTFSITNSSELIVSNTLGSTRPNIMIDGSLASFRNSSTIVSNSSSTGAQVITYWSNSGCSPNCSDVTGVDLYNSRNSSTITLDNSSSGPNSVFYARWSRVEVVNSGQIGALVGQTIQLRNSGTITFGTTVNPGGGDAYWVISQYQRDPI
jgi:Tfp pilus assembly protein PilX